MQRRRIEIALVAAALAALPGCRFGRAAGNAVTALVSSPREVAQNRHPVAPDAHLAVVWVGHSTALIQIDDKVILTDPVFTSSVGQVVKRTVQPGIDPKDLPPVDVVLVSHMHYDHLSLGSLDTIQSRIRTLLLPRGGAAYLTDFGFPAHEVPTWQTWTGANGQLRVTAVPVDHTGFRYGIDDEWMTESFTGYLIEYHGVKVYFGGDTAYDQKNFVETAQRFPGIDLALLPIGPIEPRAFLRRFHMDPREALQAMIDLGAARMVPIHYDTFPLGSDEPGDALRALSFAQRAAAQRWNLGTRLIAPIAIGERRIFLKPGEGVAADAAASPSPGSSAVSPAAPPPTKTAPTSNIPDDDKFE